MSDLYTANATRFRPEDPTALAMEARRLREAHGLTAEDISHCLRLSTEAVRALLGEVSR